MKRIRVKITGHVQGVGFRFAARSHAKELGLTGWVRNNADGTLEVVCEGEERNVDDFYDWCVKGPEMAETDSVTVEKEMPTGEFKGFAILQ